MEPTIFQNPLEVRRKLRLTFKFGFTRGSAHAFAAYGQLLIDQGNDIESALRMSRLSRAILAKTDPISNLMKPQTLFVVGYWLLVEYPVGK